jgi:hypothetical protein
MLTARCARVAPITARLLSPYRHTRSATMIELGEVLAGMWRDIGP